MSNGVELSERELEILRLVATGASNKEIALRLAISPNTVKVHLRNIFNKIGVVSRTEATLYAMRHGLVQPPGQPLSSRAVGSSQLSVDEPIPGSPLSRAPISISIPDEPSTRKKGWQTLVAGRRGRWLLITGAVLVFTAALLVVFELSSRLTPSTPRSTQATTPEAVVDRWQARAVLPIKAKGVALAVYENELYAIGGETGIGVSRKVNRFSLDGGSWNECAEKPTAVAYAQAALVGEKIYGIRKTHRGTGSLRSTPRSVGN
jgi:DNA-binding CsgD family transcriptional regulator